MQILGQKCDHFDETLFESIFFALHLKYTYWFILWHEYDDILIFFLISSKDSNNICFTAYCSEALPSNPTYASSNNLNGHTIVGKIKTYTCITGYEFNTNFGSQGKNNCVLIELCQFPDNDFKFSADKRDKSNLYKFSE